MEVNLMKNAGETAGKAKGQITIEFVAVVIILFVLFGFALVFYNSNSESLENSRELFQAKALADSIARSINDVFNAGNGAVKTVFFKQEDFNVLIANGIVQVSAESILVDSALVSKSVQVDSFGLGKQVKFSNFKGVVIVQEA